MLVEQVECQSLLSPKIISLSLKINALLVAWPLHEFTPNMKLRRILWSYSKNGQRLLFLESHTVVPQGMNFSPVGVSSSP